MSTVDTAYIIIVIVVASAIVGIPWLIMRWPSPAAPPAAGTGRDRHAFEEAYEYRHPRGTFPEAYHDRDGRFRPLAAPAPESPAQRQLRDWQERLDARQ